MKHLSPLTLSPIDHQLSPGVPMPNKMLDPTHLCLHIKIFSLGGFGRGDS